MSSIVNSYSFGLDLSDTTLRLIQLVKKGKKISIVSYGEIDLPDNTMSNGEIANEDKLVESIIKLIKNIKGKKISTRDCIAVLPETKTFIQVITIPSAKDSEKILENIKEEIKNHIPLSYEEIYLDWQILEHNNNETKVLIGAAPRDTVDSYYNAIEKAGLTPNVLEIEAAAIIRCLLDKKDDKAKIIIDFGANRTSLIVIDKGIPQFTVSLPLSGKNITSTIAKTLKIDTTNAEKAKIICGLDPEKCDGALVKILFSTISSLAKQVQKTIFFYKSMNPASIEISEVILCGGGANFVGLDKSLSEKLKLPVRVGDPMIYLNIKPKFNIPQNKILSFVTAIGLNLRIFSK